MITEYQVTHVSVQLLSSYQAFTRELEAALGRLNVPELRKAGHDAGAAKLAIESMQGEEGMTLFNMEDVGQLLSLNGPARIAKRYFVGNYMRALQIISNDMRLALYAPLRVLVYEADDKVARVEYDLPSSLFSPFGNDLITKSGLALDRKLQNLIAIAEARGKDHPSNNDAI